MTKIYFVRHAQPDFRWSDNPTRPLTAEGEADIAKVTETLRGVHLDYACSSPYIRSFRTIEQCAREHGLEVHTDERFRERASGPGANTHEMIRKRWEDFDLCEPDGESLRAVQERNIEAFLELLDTHKDRSIILGTHGTALSTILNYFDNSFNCDSFMRIINFMPYIIRLDFDGRKCLGSEELLIVEKNFNY